MNIISLIRNKNKILFLIIPIFLFCSCNSKEQSPEYKVAEEYVKFKNYNIVSFKGIKTEYTITKQKLIRLPYNIMWGLQDVNVKDYLNKKVRVIELIVTNHPLTEKIINSESNSICLYLLLIDNNIVGGYSLPSDYTVGGFYSIDGETIEEKTGMSFDKWRNWWVAFIDSLKD